MRSGLLTVLALLASLGMWSASAEAATAAITTRTRLSKFADELAKAWQTYPSEKQKDAREQQISDLSAAFNKELPALALPARGTMSRTVAAFRENLERLKTAFRQEKMAATRTLYLAACVSVFKREYPAATDFEGKTLQQCFDVLLELLEQTRDALRFAPDAQALACTAVKDMVTSAMGKAKIEKAADSVAQYDQNLREARRRFPVGTEALAKVNQPLLTMAETAAKDIQKKTK